MIDNMKKNPYNTEGRLNVDYSCERFHVMRTAETKEADDNWQHDELEYDLLLRRIMLS